MKNLTIKKKGFTLIELIIVIAIIAILAAVALPKFGEVRKSANIKADIANAKTIHSAVTTLISEDKIEIPTTDIKEFIINKDEIQGSNDTEAANLEAYLQSRPLNKYNKPVAKGTGFYVKIDNKGTVSVYVGDKTTNEMIYPNAAGDYIVE